MEDLKRLIDITSLSGGVHVRPGGIPVMDSLPARHSSGGRKQGLSCACLRAKSRKSREYLKMTKPEAVVTGKVTENQRKILEEILKDEHIIAKEVVCFINTPQRIF